MASPSDVGQSLLKLEDITLDYGDFRALNHLHFEVARAEVHALVGEHGAGKSSLAQLMSGMLAPQSGWILFGGQVYRALSLVDAVKSGIAIVHQHALSLNKYFTVAENFFLTSAFPHVFLFQKRAFRAVQAFFDQHQIDLDPTSLVKDLPVADQIFVDILKQIYLQPTLLILDEALEKLTTSAFTTIVRIVMALKQAGTSFVLITHRLDDIYNLADRVSIIKHGEILVTDEVKNIDKINLIKMAYTQLSSEHSVDNLNTEFYQLLKYNEAILRNLPVNLIVTDNTYRIKMVNEHCKQYFHLEHPSYLNVPVDDLLAENTEEVRTLVQNLLVSHEEKTFYQIPLIINNRRIISNIKTFPIYDGAFLIGQIIIIEDITEYDHLQKQVVLSEKLASVGLLAAGVAHEINNPLEIISNSLSYLKYHISHEELREAIDDIHEAMSGIAAIVSNLHAFSDNTQSLIEELDLNAIIHSMLHLIKHNAQYKHIVIHFAPSEAELPIRANKNEIKQVILNLLKNSFEAMPAGGEIFITTLLTYQNGANVVQLTFKDTGPGIGDDNPNNIFLPFYSTKKGSEHNLGLGLSVSYGIIKKYNGTITVENLPHQAGCQFLITLPLVVE